MNTAFRRKALLFLCTLLTLAAFSQQTPRTLLWRISGKGLQKPSYLYGTIHLQDKRLFQFGDSLYSAIAQTEGLATELDFRSLMDSLFTNLAAMEKKEQHLTRQKLKLDRSKLHPSVLNLLRKYGVTGNTITAKQLKDIHDYRLRQLMLGGEMSTIVDAFLVELAQRQGKWTGGIEDVEDQMDLNDVMGADLKVETVLQPEKEYRNAVEKLVTIYLAQDLDQIDAWSSQSMKAKLRDALLIKRNVKMAYRMDSLSAVRTTFFAVGAAHLPGDSGVIELLRNRGFAVDPVFSTTTINGETYASRLQQKQWNKIKGPGDAYTVEMPGEPTDVSKPGDPAKIQIFYDLTDMTLYMASHIPGYDAKTKSLDAVLQDGAKNMGGKGPLKAVAINHMGMEGRETTAVKDDHLFRIRVLARGRNLYMLISGAAEKNTGSRVLADRFFASFTPAEPQQKKDWASFAAPGKAVSVRMPVLPEKNNQTDAKADSNEVWGLSTYTATDPATGCFYLFQHRQTKSGNYIENDPAFWQATYDDYAARLDTITLFDITEYNGYPAARMDYEDRSVNGVYKALIVIRGNQVILLLGGAEKGSDMDDIDNYLQSLDLLPYEKTAWQKTEGPGFSTLAPAAFRKLDIVDTTASEPHVEQHCTYNEIDGVSYFVQKVGFSPTYWATGDSLYFEGRVQANLGEEDTLLHRTWVQNGTLRGIDFTTQTRGHSGLRRIRMLVNKDTLYSLVARFQEKEEKDGLHHGFFENFRVHNEVPATIYQSKASQLLESLNTTDSLSFARAHGDLDVVAFQKEDLPLLQQALLRSYTDEKEYTSTHSKLIAHILPLADESTLAFAEEAYKKLDGQENVVQYRLLQLLAEGQTTESFAVLKRLLLSSLPKTGNAILLQKPLLDSAELTAMLFPNLLQKANDSLFGTVVAVVAHRLVQDSLLSIQTLKAYKAPILQGAKNEWQLLLDGNYEPWELTRWARLLGLLNEPEGTTLLRSMLAQKDIPLKQAAIEALLSNGHTVPATEITKVAADRSQRVYFFEALQEMGKESLFPPLYATQKSLAESDLFTMFADDYEEFTLTYVGQRSATYQGALQQFQLFKLGLPSEEEGQRNEYLCVAGPYKTGAKEKVLYGKLSGAYGNETFNPKKIAQQLKTYLQQQESDKE
ncbi:TraB/GumN family protein [Flavisolibacter sp. BT320]|nr:TraB/GumN family protein [Flavisolibacter longurius]